MAELSPNAFKAIVFFVFLVESSIFGILPYFLLSRMQSSTKDRIVGICNSFAGLGNIYRTSLEKFHRRDFFKFRIFAFVSGKFRSSIARLQFRISYRDVVFLSWFEIVVSIILVLPL